MARVFPNGYFRNLWIANLLSMTGSQISRIGLLLFLFHETDDVVTLIGMIACETLPAVLIAPVAGVLIDRHDKKKVMVYADLFRMATVAAIIAYPSIWFIYLMGVLHSMGTAFFNPAKCASLPLIVNSDQLPKANALDQAASNFILVAGPLVGAELFIQIGLRATLLLDALTFLASALLLMKINIRETNAAPSFIRSAIKEMGNGWRYLFGNTLALHIVMLFFVSLLCVGIWLPLAPYFIRDFLGGSDRVLGIKLALFGLGGIAGSALAPRVAARMGKGMILFSALLGEGLIMTIYSSVAAANISLGICLLWGVDVSFIVVAYYSIIQQTVREDFLGRVFSIAKQSEDVAMLLALGSAMILHNFLRVNYIFLVAGAAYFLIVAASAGTRGGRDLLRTR